MVQSKERFFLSHATSEYDLFCQWYLAAFFFFIVYLFQLCLFIFAEFICLFFIPQLSFFVPFLVPSLLFRTPGSCQNPWVAANVPCASPSHFAAPALKKANKVKQKPLRSKHAWCNIKLVVNKMKSIFNLTPEPYRLREHQWWSWNIHRP